MHNFQRRKDIGLFFLALSSVTNLSEQIIRVYKVFWQLLWSYSINSVTPKRLLKTQTLEKNANFPVKKRFGLFFLALSSVTNLRNHFIGILKVFWQLLWKLQDHFCNTGEVVENTIFWKERQTFRWKKDYSLIVLQLSSVINPKRLFMRLNKVFRQLLWKL